MGSYEQGPSSNLMVSKGGFTLSTNNILVHERREWLQEVIRQEYTRVKVTPPADGSLFNEMTFYDWDRLRLSVIQSHAITIDRPRSEPYTVSQDNYLAIVLMSGNYSLEQNGREIFLKPGDMAIYDATRPHRIQCSRNFSKLIVTVPRTIMRDRIAGVEHCTAQRVAGGEGIGAVTANFIRSVANQAEKLETSAFSRLSDHYLDLLTMALVSVRPQSFNLSRSRSFSLRRVKDFVERNLADSNMDAAMVARGAGLSSRYINDLFSDEGTSLIRYVWNRRLENCWKELLDPVHIGHQITEIALRCGFNDMSHFSRAFRKKFGRAPRDLKVSLELQQSNPNR